MLGSTVSWECSAGCQPAFLLLVQFVAQASACALFTYDPTHHKTLPEQISTISNHL